MVALASDGIPVAVFVTIRAEIRDFRAGSGSRVRGVVFPPTEYRGHPPIYGIQPVCA
jgi:hypothetical protein